MTSLLLKSQQPSIFRGQKEVKKKEKNLPKIIFSVRNEKNRGSSTISKKNLENDIKNNLKSNSKEGDYSSLEKSSMERNQNLTIKKIEFAEPSFTNSFLIYSKVNYLPINTTANSEDAGDKDNYSINFNYSFEVSQTFIKGDDKRKNYYSESKEKEEEESPYTLHPFEEEKKEEERTIKWNAKEYSS